jgi:hypothetical protein
MIAAHCVYRNGQHVGSGSPDQPTSMTTRFLYQPHDGQTVCGVFALPQREQVLRAGASSFQADARVLRLFDFDFFFLGTATVGLQRFQDCGVWCTLGNTAAPGYRAIAAERTWRRPSVQFSSR